MIMLIFTVMIFSGMGLMILKAYSVISVNGELVDIVGLSLMIVGLILILKKYLKIKPSDNSLRI